MDPQPDVLLRPGIGEAPGAIYCVLPNCRPMPLFCRVMTIISKNIACLQFCAALAICKRLLLRVGICFVLLLAAGDQTAAQHNPKLFLPRDEKRLAAGETVSMARATWDTGWFQTEIFKKLLEELGYAVNKPRTMDIEPGVGPGQVIDYLKSMIKTAPFFELKVMFLILKSAV